LLTKSDGILTNIKREEKRREEKRREEKRREEKRREEPPCARENSA
jgi:hypothetical protein